MLGLAAQPRTDRPRPFSIAVRRSWRGGELAERLGVAARSMYPGGP
jgi:hypothetical protein